MESKEVKGLMQAYASIYEGYGKDKDKKKKKMHDCATHGEHSEWGAGVMIKEMHTLDEDGNITHYDVMFEHGIEKNVPVEELNITMSEKHEHFINYDKNAEVLGETRTDPRGRPASGPMSVYGGRGQDAGPGGSGDERTDRMDAAQRRVKSTQPAAKGRAADALHTRYSRRRRGTGGENPSPSDTTATGHPHSPRRGGRSGRGAETDRGKGNAAARRMREEFEGDLFDYILEHLVAEGYADTNQAALAIMANMSEEWKQDIVEGMTMKDFKANRKKLQRKEASDDAKKRGHVDRLTGKPYGTEESASRRKNLNPAERESRRKFAEDPD